MLLRVAAIIMRPLCSLALVCHPSSRSAARLPLVVAYRPTRLTADALIPLPDCWSVCVFAFHGRPRKGR